MEISIDAKIIQEFVQELSLQLVSSDAHFRNASAIFLTGSFVAFLRGSRLYQPSWKIIPDVNFYILTDANDASIASMGLRLKETIEALTTKTEIRTGRQVKILLDLHPFSISSPVPEPEPNLLRLQITARIISTKAPDRYAPYCWFGWGLNYILLYSSGKEDILLSIHMQTPLKRDLQWIRAVYLALVSYSNVIQLLALHTSEKGHLFDELYRYFKELMKDGVQIGLSDIQLSAGEHQQIFADAPNKMVPFYRDRYSMPAAHIVQSLQEIESDYFYHRRHVSYDEWVQDFYLLRDIVMHEGLMPIVQRTAPDFVRVFDVLPLWW